MPELNDISLNMDTGKVTAITPLYLSTGFDTSDYSVLLNDLFNWYDISGATVTWICSFLIKRFHPIN